MNCEVIQRLRQERGLSRRDLANAIGVSKEYIRLIENNERDGSEKTLAAIARTLQVDVSIFYGSVVISIEELNRLKRLAGELT